MIAALGKIRAAGNLGKSKAQSTIVKRKLVIGCKAGK